MAKQQQQQQQLSQSAQAEEQQAVGTGNDDIAVAAYYLAEARGFTSGNEMDDWLEAEQAVQGSSTEQQ